MKSKSILIATLSFLVSCETSNIDDIYTSPDDVSFFISQDNNCTKGTPIDRLKMLSNIGVFATLTQGTYAKAKIYEPNFMWDQKVEHVGDKWVYNPPQQWRIEPDEKISFFAYAPYATKDNGITIVEESGEMPTIRYKVPRKNNELQPDLMVAIPTFDRVKEQGVVGLTFQHALAAISFSVKGDPSHKVTDVKLRNIVPAATLSLNSSKIKWSDAETPITRSYRLGLIGGVTAPSNGDSASITANDGYFMMIPQDITEVVIEVTIDGEDDELIYLNFESGSEWVAGAKYNYVIDLDTETIEYDISQTSNCYIVNNSDIREVYIPIDQRINTFWRYYSGLSEAEAYMIDVDTEWNAAVLWCDNDDLNLATATPYYGEVPEDSCTSKSFVCDDTKAVMKVTIPDNAAIGNLLIAVSKMVGTERKILWSWHLWVTDYNPDSGNPIATTDKVYEVENGEIHRYTKGSKYWTDGAYSNTFAMDRDLGSHDNQSTDGLFYQWGRKDPFSILEGWCNAENEQATFATAVQNPNTFYADEDGWCIEPSDAAYGANDYLWYDIRIKNCEENVFKKSLFDPSPLGWCMPVIAAYREWDGRYDYDKFIHIPLSGHIHPIKAVLEEDGVTMSYWFSDKESNANAYFQYLVYNGIIYKGISTAYGHCIRPVKIPN